MSEPLKNKEEIKEKKSVVLLKNKSEISIDEYPVKCLKLGSSFSDHFEIMIIPSQKKGKICLKDRHQMMSSSYEFKEEGIKAIKEFLEMIK